MEIKLIVIRTNDIKQLSEFYGHFGLTFSYHKHGNSPYHYSATVGKTILEIYPLAKGQIDPDKNLRLGFEIEHFDKTIQQLREQKANFLTEPTQTDFGFITIVEDPDGRKIELYKL